MNSLTFRIMDMDCAEEVAILTRALEPLVGDKDRLSFDLLERKLKVDVEGLQLAQEQIEQAVRHQ